LSKTQLTDPGRFEKLVGKHGPCNKALGFTKKISQKASFRQLKTWLRSVVEPGQEISLLDVGGGIGDLWFYLGNADIKISGYSMVDTNTDFLLHAKQRLGHVLVEQETDILRIHKRYDIVVCLNMLSTWTGSLAELKRYYTQLVADMWVLTDKGIALNCISPFSDWLHPQKQPLSVEFCTDVMKQHTERVLVNLDECPHLMLVGGNLQDSEWRRTWHTDSE